jgi:RNA-dependent RNA polymerase
VTRKYSKHTFLKVQFAGDDLDKLSTYNTNDKQNYIVGYLHKLIKDGFKIGHYHFDYLAYSNSQLKVAQCWFACPTTLNFAEVELSMGDFSKEKNVLKKHARRGQCFSTSKYTCNLEPDQISTCPDVKRNGYCFTDGVGYVHP